MKLLVVCLVMTSLAGTVHLSATPFLSNDNDKEIVLQDKQKVEIEKQDLPAKVKEALNDDQFRNWKIDSIYKVTKADKSVYYSVDFTSGGQKTTVDFNKEGKVIG